ncbi:VCBS repeat-containing protein [Thalassovita litoralis]|uniref:VCBS repeat-containing protein n=1 Tax=Thalassovita litoralis TaxID=1010611 RepID=A0A521FUR3_9RHOB|nr:hypothetical protein [Thalassovita litoralis]SMO99913.1 VCBS repeat-containing protein [Thalassovita litoralis]
MKHFGSTSGLTALAEDQATQANGMVAYTTSTYNTGWMPGAIKGAFLADTDDADLVGSVYLDDDFTSYADQAAAEAAGYEFSGCTFDAANDQVDFPGTGTFTFSGADPSPNGEPIIVKIVVSNRTAGNLSFQAAYSQVFAFGETGALDANGTYYFSCTSAHLRVLALNGFDGSVDSVTIYGADTDRSMNNKGLIVNGTVTRSPVATGAELVAYSGFSASNYLESTNASYVDTLYALGWEQTNGVWEFKHGVVSTAPIDGLTITGNTLKIAGTKPKALIRLSATIPTSDQIAKIYNDEKVLFQENAACTLYGASNTVTALAHDLGTDLLHVGTSAGRSVFRGLERIQNTSTSVATAISAVNGLIAEK